MASGARSEVLVARAFQGQGAKYLGYTPGSRLDEIVRQAAAQADIPAVLHQQLVVHVEGEEVPRERWAYLRPKPDVYVVVSVRLAGGGGGGGKNGMIGALATVAFLIAAPFLVPIGRLRLFAAGAIGNTLAVSAVSFAGALLINQMFAPSTPAPVAQGQNFLVSGTRNPATPYGPVWQVFGRRKIAPPHAAFPHTIPLSDRSRVVMVLDCGFGELDITDIMIGDQPADSLEGVKYSVKPGYKAGDRLSYFTRDVDSVSLSTQVPKDPGKWAAASTADDTVKVAMDLLFPTGLIFFDKKGRAQSRTQEITIQCRETGTTSWENAPQYYADPPKSGITVGSTAISIKDKRRSAFSISLLFEMPRAAQWEFRLRTENQYTDEKNDRFDMVTLIGFRTFREGKPLYPQSPHTLLELEVTGSESLSGQLEAISCIATRRLRRPLNDGSASTELYPSRNPADAFLEVATGPANPKPLPLTAVDVVGLADWRAYCEKQDLITKKPRHRLDTVIDQQTTVWDLLQAIAGTGRATPTMRDGMLSVAWDDSEDRTPVQMFTPRNVTSFMAEKPFQELPHALRVQFVDPQLDWQQSELIVYSDGYAAKAANGAKAATRFEDLQLWGVTEPSQAYREARYVLEQGRLRPETYILETDLDHLVCTRGDRVRIAFAEALMGGKPARVADQEPINSTEVRLEFDEQMPISPGDSVIVRRQGGGQVTFPVKSIISATEIVVSKSIGALQGDLVVVGPPSLLVRDCVVKAIEPGADLTATVTLVDWNPALYDHESEAVPPYVPGISDFDPGVPPQVSRLWASQTIIYNGRLPEAAVDLTWETGDGAAPGSYAIWFRDEGAWVQLASSRDTTVTVRDEWLLSERGPDGQEYIPGAFAGTTLTFRVQPISINGDRAPLSRSKQVSIKLVADTTPPQDVERLDVSTRDRGLFLEWTEVTDPDLVGYQIRWSPQKDAAWHEMVPVVATQAYDTRQTYVPGREGRYSIKAVDSTGNRSVNAASAVVDLEFDADYDVWRTVTLGGAGGWAGTGDLQNAADMAFPGHARGLVTASSTDPDLALGGNGYVPANEDNPTAPVAGWTRTTLGDPADQSIGYTSGAVTAYDIAAGTVFQPVGTFQYGQGIDMGVYVEDVRLVTRIDAEGISSAPDTLGDLRDQWDVRVYVSTARNLPALANWMKLDDGAGNIPVDFDLDGNPDYLMPAIYDPLAGIWSEWLPITATDIKGRLFRFKVELFSRNPYVSPLVKEIEIDIDLPDRDESGEIQVGSGWTAVNYKHAFMAPPITNAKEPLINISYGGIDSVDKIEIRNRNASGFEMRLVQGPGGDPASVADVSWHVRGYGRLS